MDGIEKILIGGCFTVGLVIQKNGRIVWVNGDNGAATVMGGNLSQHDGRAPHEAANLHDRTSSRHARGEQPQKASFLLHKMTWNLLGFLPSSGKDGFQVGRNLDSSQKSSPQASISQTV